jgi:hypothetical protein
MKKVILFVSFFILSKITIGQTSFSFSSLNDENILSAINDLNGGYAFVGHYSSSAYPGFFMRMDSAGSVVAAKSYGIQLSGCLIQTPDSNYIVVGQQTDSAIMKVDKLGNIIWSENFSLNSAIDPIEIINSKDGGFILTGIISTNTPYHSKAFLAKFDAMGNKIWASTYEIGILTNNAVGVVELSDSSIMLTLNTNNSSSEHPHVIRTSSQGALIWCKEFSTGVALRLDDIEAKSNEAFILYSILYPNPHSGMMSIDSSANINWSRSSVQNLFGGRFHLCENGSFIVTNDMPHSGIFELNSGAGSAACYEADPGMNNFIFSDIIQTSDNGFLITAFNSNSAVIKMDSSFISNGCLSPYGVIAYADDSILTSDDSVAVNSIGQIIPVTVSSNNFSFSVIPGCNLLNGFNNNDQADAQLTIYPNPSVGEINLQCESDIHAIQIYDAFGKLVYENNSGLNKIKFDIVPGIYCANIFAENKIFKRKIIIE